MATSQSAGQLTEVASGDLKQRLEDLAAADSEYWSFVNRGERDFMHSLIRYPAMMVPELQRELLQTCVAWDPRIERVYDPFVGSGTVMTETMLLGRDFIGSDINPLAILACRAKSEFLNAAALGRDLVRLREHVAADRSAAIDVQFPGRDKWFETHVAEGLCQLRRAVMARPFRRTRRFWWVVFAEVVRLVSNSRTSTVKLHLRPAAEVAARPDPVTRFWELAERAIVVVGTQQAALSTAGHMSGSQYNRTVELSVADVRGHRIRPADLLMSSPPYGDNHTTVTYGQASYLPLQWIPSGDIADHLDHSLIASTHAIDTASLGGSRRHAIDGAERALDRSASLRRCFDRLKDQPRDRRVRVAAFFRDFDIALDSIADNLRPGAVMLWTVGDRSVGGQRIPLAIVLRQLLGRRALYVTDLSRSIPGAKKRMPARNALTNTMGAETILVLRKADES